MWSSGERRTPLFRPRCGPIPELADFELALLALLRQLDSANSDRRVVESLESPHWPNPLFHSPVVLFDQVVQGLARSDQPSVGGVRLLLSFPGLRDAMPPRRPA